MFNKSFFATTLYTLISFLRMCGPIFPFELGCVTALEASFSRILILIFLLPLLAPLTRSSSSSSYLHEVALALLHPGVVLLVGSVDQGIRLLVLLDVLFHAKIRRKRGGLTSEQFRCSVEMKG